MNKMIFWTCLMTLFFASTSVEFLDAQTTQKKAVAVGDQAPDFELETFDGKTVKLSERFGANQKPVVLLFSRAHW